MTLLPCEQLRDLYFDAAVAGWSCTPMSSGGVLVSGPLSYSDGDLPELLVTAGEGGVVVVSDFGSTAGRLDLHMVQISGPTVDPHVQRIVRGYGVELTTRGELRVEGAIGEVGPLLMRMGAAMLQLDALIALRSAPPTGRFAKRLLRWLDGAVEGTVNAAAKVRGSSGKVYTVTAEVVPTDGQPVLLQAVTKTKTDNRAVDHAFRIFSEVNGQFATHRKLTVLAEAPASFDRPDLELLERVSYLATWAQQEPLRQHLNAPTVNADHRIFAESAPPLT